jgi:hypothetical protein
MRGFEDGGAARSVSVARRRVDVMCAAISSGAISGRRISSGVGSEDWNNIRKAFGFESARAELLYPEDAAMLIRVLLNVLVWVVVSTAADAFSTTAGDKWSDLRVERLQQLPSPVRAALLNAQKTCGEESISVRSGFIRYLKDANGNELIVLHFDQFHCANGSALCTSSGCLHQIFLAAGASFIAKSGMAMFKRLT